MKNPRFLVIVALILTALRTFGLEQGPSSTSAPANPLLARRAEAVSEQRQQHWAFQPVRKPAPPRVKNAGWAQTPIDAFILAKLEEKDLRPAPPADRRTLCRRASFDLIGLPPTPEQVAAFEADSSPDAFAHLVDSLLASPHYGERWGRYWLDVARYADTKGYVFNQERRYPYSYTYRDYVIRAFNEDLPYDRFILEQLAADRLPLGEDKHSLAAMGFLTLGRRFMNNKHDIIDDRIDVVTRGLLGLTVSCARCHDHKFDPIPSSDYYSLYGVFASSVEPRLPPALGMPPRTEAYRAFEKQLQEKERKLKQFLEAKHQELITDFRSRVADYLLAGNEAQNKPKTEQFMFVVDTGELNPAEVERWRKFLQTSRKNQDPVFAPWNALADLSDKEFSVSAVTAKLAASDPARSNPLVVQALTAKPPTSLREAAQRYGDLFLAADKLWQEAVKKAASTKAPASGALTDPAWEQLRQAFIGPGKPLHLEPKETEDFLLDRASRDRLRALRSELEKLRATSPGAQPRAMVLEDASTPYEPHVFRRGNPNNLGPAVPRQFLEVLAGPSRQPFHQGSGRLELAQAIANKDNLLTARVLVNRVWLHHFSAGLVRTPSDFGLRSDPPTHPELLDYLAATFMEDGWSIKKLHRLIMLSGVYQQSSDPAEGRGQETRAQRQVDPENRLLWKMNRRRLDFEAQRDALLFVAGRLDPRMGGPPIELTTQPFNPRRTVYGFIDRQNLPGLFRTFDFASPDTTSPQRFETTVPQQALFMMNSPFVVEQVRELIRRPEIDSQKDPKARIQALYRLLYTRTAEPEEVSVGLQFLHDSAQSATRLTPWEQYAQVLLEANELMFVD
jgi:hypothetical protein